MSFFQDARLGRNQSINFGEYVQSFESDTKQVRADLFKNGARLFAYVSFATGYDATNVTDPWVGLLRTYAAERGFDGLQIVYTGSVSLTGQTRLRPAGV